MDLILFYSNKCNSCKNFIQLLKNNNINNLFKMKCIDGIQIDKLLKTGIKNVPTLLIKGQNGKTALYECINAFIWIDNFIKYNKNAPSQEENIVSFLDGYKVDELEGISDTYAFLQSDDPLPKSFQPYGKDNQFKILTLPSNNEKILDKDQNILLKKIESERDKQTQQLREQMEKTHLDIMMKS